MKNFVAEGDVTTIVVAPYAAASGTGVLVGANLFGVATEDIASGAAGEILTEGIVDIAKTSALAINAGDRLFWDNVNKVVNTTAAAQVNVGTAIAAAGNPSPTVRMRLGSSTPSGT